jgi:perosamine synthetase
LYLAGYGSVQFRKTGKAIATTGSMENKTDPIPLFEIDWSESDIETVTDSIQRGGYWAKGPYVDTFEEEIETYLGVDHALVVNSGTTALVAALEGLGIGKGDEVIVPSFTFIATANAVQLAGAEPVFADIERETYGLDPESVEHRITDDTAAILPVHCYGAPCRIHELAAVASDHDVALLEDAAEGFGAEADGQMLGTIGDAATLSFCQNKIVPTGEGGAVVTDDEGIARRVKLYRSHGRATEDYFDSASSGEYVTLGTNIRMSDMTAALGCSQLDRVEDLIAGRQRAADMYAEGFAVVEGVTPHRAPAGGTHVHQLYTVELAPEIDRAHVIETLTELDISAKVYWDPPVHRTAYYRERGGWLELPVTDDIAGRVLSVPMHPNLSEGEVRRVVAGVEAAIEAL